MFILGILSAGIVIFTIICSVLRLSFELKFAAIQKEPDQLPLFRRKVNHLRKLEQDKHIRYLLIACLSIGIALILFIGSFLFLANDYQKMKRQVQEMNEQPNLIVEEQNQLFVGMPLKYYPKEGIGLNEYQWDKLTGETKNSTLQKQIEEAISLKTMQYFGSLNTTVSLAVPQTLSLQIKCWTDDNFSNETIKKNIETFVKEAEAIPNLTDIHIRMVTSVDENKQILHSVNYARERKDQSFNEKNNFEQKLKNNGGKG